MRMLFVILSLLFSQLIFAQNDAQGCSVHPLFSKMPQAYISRCDTKEFDEIELYVAGGRSEKKKGEKVEVVYLFSGNPYPSKTQVFQNHVNAIKQANGQVLYQGGGSITGKIVKGGSTWWVEISSDGSNMYIINSVREAPMKQEVVVTAADIKKKMGEEGKVTFYGIYFDTDKSDIKPESDATLKEMAAWLKANANVKVFIVGHTDNSGELNHNLTLSKSRASAVVQALTTKYAVNKAQLAADGVGPLSPVTTNTTEEGKALNRRVELVLAEK